MLPSRKDYDRARRGVERALAEPPHTVDDAIGPLLEAVADVLAVDSSCWHRTDPASGQPVDSGVLGDPPGSLEWALDYEFQRPDVSRFAQLTARRVPVAALSEETRGRPATSARYREMIAPAGAADELRVSFRDGFGIWAVLALFTRRRLNADDLAFVASLEPIATAAVRKASAAQALAPPPPDATADEPGGPSVLLLDPADRVLAADATARRRLALVPDGRDVAIPGLISFLAARARWDAAAGPASARMRMLDGRWFTVDASRLDGDAGGSVAVVLQPAASTAVLDGLLRALGLSAREREVAALAAEGRSAKEIAGRLFLSPWTVQDHLKAAYEKTGARSRAELAALAG